MTDSASPGPGGGLPAPIAVFCRDAVDQPRATTVFVRDHRVIVVQPEPGEASYDWVSASELTSALATALATIARGGTQ